MTETDLFADLRRAMEAAEAQPKRPEYIVLDHGLRPGEAIEVEDRRGRRCLMISPSILDAVRHKRVDYQGLKFDLLTSPHLHNLAGIPVYTMDVARKWLRPW